MKLVLALLLFVTISFFTAACKKQDIKETFFSKSEKNDLIAFTGAPGGLLPPTPISIREFTDSLAGGMIVLTEIRNSNDKVTGFAAELEVIKLEQNGLFSDSDWELKIPGRGALFLTQTEDITYIYDMISDMKKHNETRKSFNPPFEVITTVPGTGKIIGGTKEFKNICGTFKEINRLRHLDIEAGKIAVDVELEITYKKTEN